MYSTNRPLLLSDLRLALATLYSLPPPPLSDPRTKPSSTQAHNYLINFQTRNPRRKQHSQSNNNKQKSNDTTDAGSSWLACIDLVSNIHDQVQYAEALFAAQTLVHRLRRVKLAEAIDIEFEPIIADSFTTLPLQPEQILEGYRRWIMAYYQGSLNSSFDIVSQLVHNYRPVDPQQQINTMEYEEKIKGELSMILLASILDALVKSCYQQQQQQQLDENKFSHVRPLLKTLASSIAVISARMRYISSSLPAPAIHTQPMVTTILTMIQSQTQHYNQNQEVVLILYYTVLTAIPEAVLAGSGGGAYGRLSLDPRCYIAVTRELKTQGMIQVQFIRELIASSTTINSTLSVLLLQMCEAWAKHVPLPIEFVNSSVSLVLRAWEQPILSHQSKPQTSLEAKAAMAYWIAIMESGAWTIDQVLASSLIQTKEGQSNKKKQSSKSRKRNQQILEEKATHELLTSARDEVRHRREAACTMAQQTWNRFEELLRFELQRIAEDSNPNSLDEQDVRGDGPVGAIAACANACLPYLLRESAAHQDATSMSLFVSISQSIKQICASPSRMVRGFAAESLYTLHDVLSKILTSDDNSSLSKDQVEVIISHFFQSCMNLASQCGYPSGYFNNLGQDNDEDLESERNDVREVLRTISGFPSATSICNEGYPASLIAISSSILLRLMQGCAQPIQEAATSNTLFPEIALHAFSALAKPINTAASLYLECVNQGTENNEFVNILNLAFEIITAAGRCLIFAFPVAPPDKVLPLSRLYNLAIASLSPMLSKLAQIPTKESEVRTIMRVGIEAAATSMLRLPELTGPSSLRSTRFDIRGAMRSPGGEDHVGVLTLMRLAYESDHLSLIFLRSKASILVDLVGLYQELKKIEEQRGAEVFYGIGVLPKSRRILLGVICHLEIISGGTAQASGILAAIFENAIISIASVSSQLEHLQAEHLYCICESTFDIAAFSSNAIQSLFNVSDRKSLQAICLRVLHIAGNFGFVSFGDANIPNENIIQWNRLRAALFTLLRISGKPDIPASISEMLISLITTECESVIVQCSGGPTSCSKIFREDIISEETGLPPGIGIRVLLETLEKACLSLTPLSSMRNCLHVLYSSRQAVLHTLISECSMPVEKGSFHDPRPVIAETWFLCMNRIAMVTAKREIDAHEEVEVGTVIKQLLVETFVVVISLLFYSSLEKTQDKRANDPGMSLDGPQGLVMIEYVVSFFNLGSVMIQSAMKELLVAIPVATSHDPDADGIAIIGAALFRGSQGGLPPWAVESIPSVYSSLFNVLNKNVNTFGLMFELSMNIRLKENSRFGGIEGGSLLSGKFFKSMNDKARLNFVSQAKELASTDTTASWRRLKSVIKQACGGKKKDTDFKQRPALTSWDSLDRI